MVKVAITGSTGLIGSRIQELLYQDFEFIPLLQKNIDITDNQQVADFVKNHEFDILLHLAGYTNVDGAESEKELTHKINVEGTKNLFDAVGNKGKNFIYISTDFVFDGEHPPYFEDSNPNPLGYYGKTKHEGEKIVKDHAMIVRISYPFRAAFDPKKDFVRTIKSLLEDGRELSMVTDSSMTPTFIDDITYGLRHLIKNFTPEIYHLVGPTSFSPFQAGKLIARTFQLNENLIKPTTYDEYFKGKAPRPRYSEIRSRKNNFYKMKTFAEALKFII